MDTMEIALRPAKKAANAAPGALNIAARPANATPKRMQLRGRVAQASLGPSFCYLFLDSPCCIPLRLTVSA